MAETILNLYIYESVSDTNISIFEGESFVKHPDTLLRSGDWLMLMTDASLRFYDLQSRTETRNVALGTEAAWHPLCAMDGAAYLLRIDGESGELSVVVRDMSTGAELREDRLSVYDFFQRNGFLKAPYSREDALYLDTFYSSSAPVAVQNDCVYLHDAENSRVITARTINLWASLSSIMGRKKRLRSRTISVGWTSATQQLITDTSATAVRWKPTTLSRLQTASSWCACVPRLPSMPACVSRPCCL